MIHYGNLLGIDHIPGSSKSRLSANSNYYYDSPWGFQKNPATRRSFMLGKTTIGRSLIHAIGQKVKFSDEDCENIDPDLW
ncbi:MAG: hypothetical protein U5K00_17845 [Melioribacteraceae bacterium]|nr:hypothetical protein [Melioribacteraceae bacterium]